MEAEAALRRGIVVDISCDERPFVWHSREHDPENESVPEAISWENRVDAGEKRIVNEVAHFTLKKDLVEHVCQTWRLL